MFQKNKFMNILKSKKIHILITVGKYLAFLFLLGCLSVLLLFIYLEVIGMVLSFYGSHRIRLTYPLFIAITAIARLMILQKTQLPLFNITIYTLVHAIIFFV